MYSQSKKYINIYLITYLMLYNVIKHKMSASNQHLFEHFPKRNLLASSNNIQTQHSNKYMTAFFQRLPHNVIPEYSVFMTGY